ncbi:M48 family metalloprotease [Ramlibacter sp.]|uniref:M48 family metalloprotease n=1 Tax=Ramlibacter sp. TaxID=1917967 RepID=UPI003D13A302
MTGSRTAAALLAMSLLALPLSAQTPLPSLGGGDGDMSVAAERRMGERIARELFRDHDYIDDPIVVEYVQKIWQPLLAAARTRGDLTPELDERFAWQVLLGKDRTINAFALPGGWLGLHMGLIAVTATRDELASVLAHELSHVTQRHIARMMTQQSRQTPWVIGAMILGALAASKSPEAGNAIITGSQAAAAQGQLNFSRDMEREADRIGYGVLTQAGFEPQGFVGMFEKLQQAARHNDFGAFPYLRTHPINTERIADMQARQQLLPRAPAAAPTFEHAMMAGRARVISNPNVDALRAQLGEPNMGTFASLAPSRQAGVLYAAALAASRLRDGAAAQTWLARLGAVAAGDPAGARLARLLGAEIALAAGDPSKALATLDTASSARPEALLVAQARLAARRIPEATNQLQTWVATWPRDATAWQLLAQAYAAQGQALRSIRAEAEGRVAELDYAAAIDRLKAAQELIRRGATDHIEASIIDTRTRQVESLLREQALER